MARFVLSSPKVSASPACLDNHVLAPCFDALGSPECNWALLRAHGSSPDPILELSRELGSPKSYLVASLLNKANDLQARHYQTWLVFSAVVLNWGDRAELGNGGQESEYILGKRSLGETGGFPFKDGPEIKCWGLLCPSGLANGTVHLGCKDEVSFLA